MRAGMIGAALVSVAAVVLLVRDVDAPARARSTSAGARVELRDSPVRDVAEPASTPPSPRRERRDAPQPRALPPLLEPSPAAIRSLERASQRRDPGALMALARSEPSLVRYEALRRYVRLTGPAGLKGLLPLLESSDARLHAVLGSAFGAGGRASLAEQLSARIPILVHGSAQLAAATAVLEIGERQRSLPHVTRTAIEMLERLAISPDLGADACRGLGSAGAAGLPALERIASDASQAEATRLIAAQVVGATSAAHARPLLRTLAEQARDPDVRQLAAVMVERLP